MSKKTFISLIVILLAVIAVVVWFFFFYNGGNSGVNRNATSTTDLFPFGKGTGGVNNTLPSTNNNGGGTQTNNNGSISKQPRLRHISLVPTAGVVAFDRASTTMVRYVERATGHVYETPSDSTEVKKISNTTVPKIHEVFWSKDGNSLLMRYLKDDNETIRTFYARLSTTTDMDNSLEGMFLDDNIKDISVYDNKIFYLSKNSLGAQGIVANIDGSKKVAVFNSTYGDWREVWGGPKFVTLFTRPSVSAIGDAYTLNTLTGEYSKTLGGISGLSANTNTDGSYVIGSGANGNSISTYVFDVVKSATSRIGVSTLADKCIWSGKEKVIVYCAVPNSIPSAQYPDSWYRGSVSFNDSVWKIDVSSGNTELIFDPTLEGESVMDIVSLGLSNNEDILVFINKKDLTAWRYKLSL